MTSSVHPPSIEDLAVATRLLWSLPRFLPRPITSEEARATLTDRVERRVESFLTLAERAIYENPCSPYGQLLRIAGCELGDLHRLVGQDGLEAALATLFRRGVYLTVDELKGRRPAIRGSARVDVRPDLLHGPTAGSHLPMLSSGSRGAPTPTNASLAHLWDQAIDIQHFLDARGGLDWVHALWLAPGGSAIARLLEYAKAGAPFARWYSQVDPAAPGLHVRYRWIGRVLWLAGKLAGVPQPRPAHVPLDAPEPIVRWTSAVLRSGRTPHFHSTPSSAVRLCRAAATAGIDLAGAQFTLSGEACTEARLATVRAAGATAVPSYASVEPGRIAYGCLAPQQADDMHLAGDRFAVIQPGVDGVHADLPPAALLLTALQPTARNVLLNASLGDQAAIVHRRCGCPLDVPGREVHLHSVRSFEKLTAGGMTFLDTDVIRVLEELLPSRFGGGPTDYQLMEGETSDGMPDVRLLVHPSVGPLDPAAVTSAFLETLGQGAEGERMMALQWHQAGLPRVDRRPPVVTAGQKILHFHQERSAAEGKGQRCRRAPTP